MRPADHSQQTEILDRNTGVLQEISGNFFLSKQVSMGSACFSSTWKRPVFFSFLLASKGKQIETLAK